MIKSSITDSPRDVSIGELDNFGIEPFENGLTKFINSSNTPITIALQGEWGSGKTSLMNSLKKNLSDSENSKYHSIWLNTWEYALMKDAQSTLMDIITGLIQETSKRNRFTLEQSGTLIVEDFSTLSNVAALTLETGAETGAETVPCPPHLVEPVACSLLPPLLVCSPPLRWSMETAAETIPDT